VGDAHLAGIVVARDLALVLLVALLASDGRIREIQARRGADEGG
jgi:hypothetical protein